MQIKENIDGYRILAGYDEPLDYVFMVIEDISTDEMIYSNLDLPNAFDIKDFNYFVNVAKNDYNLDLSHMTEKIHAAKK